MSEQHTHSEQYDRARRAFDELRIEDKAVFLLEATVSTMARGIEQAGRALADELDDLFRAAEREAETPEPPEPPSPEAGAGPTPPPPPPPPLGGEAL